MKLEINRYLHGAHVRELMTIGKTTLIQNDPSKEHTRNNYGRITCLPTMWNILTAQIREEIHYSLTSRGLFPQEQKGCRKGSKGTAELLYIDQHILNERKIRWKNLAKAWIHHKKAYDKVPQSWIINCIFIEKTMSGIDSRRKKLSWSKDPKRYFSRKCTITEMHSRIQT